MPSGFLHEFTKEITSRLPGANPDYIFMCAEGALAGVCFRISHYNAIGKMNLGLWSLGIGRSGSWKTVPLRNYVIPILNTVQKSLPSEGRLRKRILVPSRFSPEGLIEFMTVHKEVSISEETGEDEEILAIYNEGIMIRDEFTGMMKGIKNKQWMSDVSELLSEVYDASIQPYYTKKSKLQSVPYCNLSFMMATTPHIYDIIDETFFVQGLGNRIDYVPFDPPDDTERIDPGKFFGFVREVQERDTISRFASKLLEVLSSRVRIIDIDPSSKTAKMWVNYRHEIETKKRNFPPEPEWVNALYWSYLSRQAEKALRRSGVYCVSRNIDSISKMRTLDTLLVNEEDMRLAILRQEKLFQFFEILIKRWMLRAKPRGAPQTDFVDIERMLTIIDDTPYKIISNPQWMMRAGYGHQNKFYNLKRIVIQQGSVIELSLSEKMALPKRQKEWLELSSPNLKIYRLSNAYFKTRGLRNPYKK